MSKHKTKFPVIREISRLKGQSIIDLFAALAREPNSALLLSGGEHDCSRFSYIGYDPFCIVKSKGAKTQIIRGENEQRVSGDPFSILQKEIDRYRIEDPGLDTPLTAGAMGFLGYELKNHIERLPQTAHDDLLLPDLYFCLYRMILIHDSLKNEWLLSCFLPDGEPEDCRERMNLFLSKISMAPGGHPDVPPQKAGNLKSNFSREQYLGSVERVRRYIIDGHIYQANISQRFTVPYGDFPYNSFVHLFNLNPAPFYAYINGEDFQVISTSPERFLFQRGAYVESRPIKGTIQRGKTKNEDDCNKNNLMLSFKDDAEISMIVDLMRNDISRVCRGETVRVNQHKRIEAYSNVFHLVSIVTGQMSHEKDRFDLIRACFPGGSITGCPKIRSMEIIDEIEPHARGVYTGSIGYLSFHDSMDLNIAIRTSVVRNGSLHFNVGGGIVFDSNPEEEYMETLYKGESILASLGFSLNERSIR
jgi:para-aminobenzoate synthetase component 1